MAGTKIGGQAAAKTNKERFGEDFYVRIGKAGGSGTRPQSRYFYRNKEAARIAGAKGGTISRRGKKVV